MVVLEITFHCITPCYSLEGDIASLLLFMVLASTVQVSVNKHRTVCQNIVTLWSVQLLWQDDDLF
jgi:hypothetical protein